MLQLLYLIAIFVLSIALGVQVIVLPWLVVDFLSLSSVWVGWIQAAVLLPNLLFLLLGGMMADKGKSAIWLVPLLLINIVIHSSLFLVIEQHWFSIVFLLFYALILGMSNAFVQPWREYLLKTVFSETKGTLQTYVARSILCLYIGQAVGIASASLMDDLGVRFLLLLQIFSIGIATVCFTILIKQLSQHGRLLKDQADGGSDKDIDPIHHRTSQSIVFGFKQIWRLPALRSLVAIAGFNGFFHIGVFIVVLPLIVQQLYDESVNFYSALQFTFVAGTITATLVVIFKKFLDAPGKRVIFGLLYGGVILLSLSAKPTLTGLFILIFFWGLVVGVSVNMGRSLLQSLSPEATRGRIISIYQLALFGFSPLGALFAGYAIVLWGIILLLKMSGVASLLFFALFLMTRALWDAEINTEG